MLLLAILFVLFLTVILPRQAQASAPYSGAVGSPDLMFSYGPEKLYSMAADYGPEGRQHYIRSRLTFDIAYPLVYGFFLATTISFTFRSVWPEYVVLHRFARVALAAMAADLLENLSLVAVMAAFPDPLLLAAAAAASFTVAKWILLGLALLLSLVGVFAWLITRVRTRLS